MHSFLYTRAQIDAPKLTTLAKNKKMPNGWRTIKSLVHEIRLYGRRGKGKAESFPREKVRHAPQKEGGGEILCDLHPVWPRLVRPTSLMPRINGKKAHKHNGGLLPDIILWTQDYYHQGTRLNTMYCRDFLFFAAYETVYYYYHVGCCTIILFLFCFFFLSGVPAWQLM